MTTGTKRLVRAVLVLPVIGAAWLLTGTLVFAVSGSSDAAWIGAVFGESAAAVAYIRWMRRNPIEQAEARREQMTWLPAHAGRAALEPRPFEPFGFCPGCSLPGYHLLSPPREQQDPAKAWAWALAVGQVWSREGAYEMRNQAPAAQLRALPTITVVTRECLPCGETWLETM